MLEKRTCLKKNYFNLCFFSHNFNLYKLFFFYLVDSLKIGDIIYVRYLDNSNILNTRSFIGLCFFLRKSNINFFFGLRNNLNKDFLEFIFSFYSPFILELKRINKYSKKFRLSKLYFFRINNVSF